MVDNERNFYVLFSGEERLIRSNKWMVWPGVDERREQNYERFDCVYVVHQVETLYSGRPLYTSSMIRS